VLRPPSIDTAARDPFTEIGRSTELGKLIEGSLSKLAASPSFGEFVREARGRACLSSKVNSLPHPAAIELLVSLRNDGAPVELTTAEWSKERVREAMNRGSHQSADEYLGFVEEEMTDFIRKGFWLVLPFAAVQHLPDLRISPLGVVPQRNRRPRLIVDYTFSGVNEETRKMAPGDSMQFGRALDRIRLAVLEAPDEFGPTYMMKLDLSDGFYRIQVKPEDVPKLAIAFPTGPGEEKKVAFPMKLPMGWTESPPWFCAATETIVDVANDYCGTSWDPPSHRLEGIASSTPTDPPTAGVIHEPEYVPRQEPELIDKLPPKRRRKRRRTQPCLHLDVFVDDELAVAQGSLARLQRIRRQLLHINDLVFRPNDANDQHRKEPASVKKLRQGDASWSTVKIVLGWLIDSLKKTIQLPPHRLERLQTLLNDYRGRKSISQKQSHRLMGELRSMALGIPGSAGLLSLLQNELKQALQNRRRVHLKPATKSHIRDILALAGDLARRPTRLAELFPTHPAHGYGVCDAAKSGFGGSLFPSAALHTPPIVWREPLPTKLQDLLVSEENTQGSISNSDLELAGTIMQEVIWSEETSIVEKTILTGCDNTPAVAWRHKGSNSLDGPSAYLLREASMLQRQQRHVPRLAFLPGTSNVLGDVPSRKFEWTDSQLLQFLNAKFPQDEPWQMRRLPAAWRSRLISALLTKSPAPLSLETAPRPPTASGKSAGFHSFLKTESTTLSSPASTTKSRSLGFLPRDCATDGSHVVGSPSDLTMYATRSFTSQRRSPTWGPRTPDSTNSGTWTSDSPASTGDGKIKTPLPTE
jgi:hypothetical protein